MFSSGCPNVRRGPAASREPSPTTWQPWQPMSLTICSPFFASPRGGFLTANSCLSLFANRYAAIAAISASLRGTSSGPLLFELYQKRGIHVVGFTARGLRIQFLTQSCDSFESIFVRIGPGLRMLVSKPLVLWQGEPPARSEGGEGKFTAAALGP